MQPKRIILTTLRGNPIDESDPEALEEYRRLLDGGPDYRLWDGADSIEVAIRPKNGTLLQHPRFHSSWLYWPNVGFIGDDAFQWSVEVQGYTASLSYEVHVVEVPRVARRELPSAIIEVRRNQCKRDEWLISGSTRVEG
jgi:hypothetical protein